MKIGAIKIYDDASDHTFGENTSPNDDLKKQISVNIPTVGTERGFIEDGFDQVKFRESQSEVSQFVGTRQKYNPLGTVTTNMRNKERMTETMTGGNKL